MRAGTPSSHPTCSPRPQSLPAPPSLPPSSHPGVQLWAALGVRPRASGQWLKPYQVSLVPIGAEPEGQSREGPAWGCGVGHPGQLCFLTSQGALLPQGCLWSWAGRAQSCFCFLVLCVLRQEPGPL